MIKIMNMREWSLFREAADYECIFGGQCIPSPKNPVCVDCYGEYVEKNLISDKKVVLKDKCDD